MKAFSEFNKMLILAITSIMQFTFAANAQGNNTISMDDFSIRKDGTAIVEVKLDNENTDFVGFQMDIFLGTGLTMMENSMELEPSRMDGSFTLSSAVRLGAYRVLVGSLPVSTIWGNSGSILSFKVKASSDFAGSTVSIGNILFTTKSGNEVALSNTSCNVSLASTPVSSIVLSHMSASIMVGETLALSATVLPANATDNSVTWKSSNTSVASVTDEGVVKALAAGTTTITATANDGSGVSASCVVSITPDEYKLTYIVNGEIYNETMVKVGAAIIPEAEPTKEGYTFSGWSEIPAAMPAHDVEVYGTFNVNKYKVTFISDGAVIKEEILDYGTQIIAPANPTKVGHTFSGWNPTVDATVPAHDVTYTAQFSVNQYTITFDTDGGSAVAPITQNYGTAITKPADPTKDGYTFAGWNPAIPETMPAENMTIKSQWTVNNYKLTYKVDGAICKEYTLSYGDSITPEAEPAKEGYTFSGWSEIPATMPAHDVEVNGSFEVNIYKVSYYVDEELVHQDEVAFGDTFELWTYDPEVDDLTFNGWIGELYETMPAHDISYIADMTSGIYYIINNPENVQGIYTLDGKKVEKIRQGVYVIRMKDGTVRKVIKK